MAILNKCMFIGHAGKDPVVRQFDNGSIATFTLAVSEKYKDRNGDYQEKTEWLNIVVGGNLVDVVSKYVSKGTPLFVEGKIRNREFTGDDGQKRYMTEIVCVSLQILAKRETSQDNGSYRPAQQSQPSAPAQPQRNIYRQQPRQVQPQAPTSGSFFEENSDDLPF